MEEAQESMDCSDSEMIPSSPKEEAGPEQEDIPEIGMEQDVAADPGDSKKCKRFESYDDMMAMIDDLKAHNHPLRVFNSQTVEECNKRRAKAKQPLEPIDKKWRYTYYSVRCVHYGQGRRRSKGVRPNQRHLSLNCPAKLTVSYDRVAGCLVVRECLLSHNHRIGSEIMEQYASSRRLSLKQQHAVNELLSVKPNNKRIKDHIHSKYKKFVTLKDIQNMKAKMKQSAKNGRRDEQILLDSLENALKQDSAAKGGVTVNEDDQISIVHFQSGQMSELFVKFPEILLVDGTYNVNQVGMPLYCFMVEDGFGNGRNVFYAATAEEDSAHLQRIIQSFKVSNPAWSNVHVIVIDKDFTELQALQIEFPQASILYCQFHVIKCFFKQLTDLDVPKDNRDEARQLVRTIVHAKSEPEYERMKQELFDATNHAFKQYFLNNWDSCREKWVTFLRDENVHFANTTNNRLECHNHKLKDVTARSMSISENVLLFSRSNASEYDHKSFVEELSSFASADDCIPGVLDITSSCTAYSAKFIIKQLKLSQEVQYKIEKGSDDDEYTVAYSDHEHHVSLLRHRCSCSFSKVMGLPCRHLFAVRASQNLPVFELQLVADRWRKDYQLLVGTTCDCDGGMEDDEANNGMSLSRFEMKAPSTSTLSRNQKYKKVIGIGQKLAMVASECGMPEFRRKCSTIESLLQHWENNVEVCVVPVQDVADSKAVSSAVSPMKETSDHVDPPETSQDTVIKENDSSSKLQTGYVDPLSNQLSDCHEEGVIPQPEVSDNSLKDRLELSVLRENIKLKQHIKTKGRPKSSCKLWPSKKKKTSTSFGKENQPHVSSQGSKTVQKCKKRRMYQPGTAANRLRIKRERRRKQMAGCTDNDGSNELSIVLPSGETESDSERTACMTVAGTALYPSDIGILQSSRKWLNERLINAGQAMIKAKFPRISGLQDVGRSDTCTFEEEGGNFVQILNIHDTHWICVTNVDSKSNEVKVYDSMCTGDIPMNTKEVVASLVRLSQTYIFLTFPDVQQQVGSSDCGLYSLAFANTLSSGKDPAKLEYNQMQFREHFLECLKKGDITPFPHDTVMKNPQKPSLRKFSVYCLCRLPNTGDSMVQCCECKEWFHFSCIGLDEDASLPEEWHCTVCTNIC